MIDKALVAEILGDLRKTLLEDEYGSRARVLADLGTVLTRSTRALSVSGGTVMTLDLGAGDMFELAALSVALLALTVAEGRKGPVS